jgi:hypothetical protein
VAVSSADADPLHSGFFAILAGVSYVTTWYATGISVDAKLSKLSPEAFMGEAFGKRAAQASGAFGQATPFFQHRAMYGTGPSWDPFSGKNQVVPLPDLYRTYERHRPGITAWLEAMGAGIALGGVVPAAAAPASARGSAVGEVAISGDAASLVAAVTSGASASLEERLQAQYQALTLGLAVRDAVLSRVARIVLRSSTAIGKRSRPAPLVLGTAVGHAADADAAATASAAAAAATAAAKAGAEWEGVRTKRWECRVSVSSAGYLRPQHTGPLDIYRKVACPGASLLSVNVAYEDPDAQAAAVPGRFASTVNHSKAGSVTLYKNELMEPACSSAGAYNAAAIGTLLAGGPEGAADYARPGRVAATSGEAYTVPGDSVIIHIHLNDAGPGGGNFLVTVTAPVCEGAAEALVRGGWVGVSERFPLAGGIDPTHAALPPLSKMWAEQALALSLNDPEGAAEWLAAHVAELAGGTGVGALDPADMLAVSRGVYLGKSSGFELTLHTAQLYLRRREVVPVPASFRNHADFTAVFGTAAASVKLRGKSSKAEGEGAEDAATGAAPASKAAPRRMGVGKAMATPAIRGAPGMRMNPDGTVANDAEEAATSALCAVVGTQRQRAFIEVFRAGQVLDVQLWRALAGPASAANEALLPEEVAALEGPLHASALGAFREKDGEAVCLGLPRVVTLTPRGASGRDILSTTLARDSLGDARHALLYRGRLYRRAIPLEELRGAWEAELRARRKRARQVSFGQHQNSYAGPHGQRVRAKRRAQRAALRAGMPADVSQTVQDFVSAGVLDLVAGALGAVLGSQQAPPLYMWTAWMDESAPREPTADSPAVRILLTLDKSRFCLELITRRHPNPAAAAGRYRSTGIVHSGSSGEGGSSPATTGAGAGPAAAAAASAGAGAGGAAAATLGAESLYLEAWQLVEVGRTAQRVLLYSSDHRWALAHVNPSPGDRSTEWRAGRVFEGATVDSPFPQPTGGLHHMGASQAADLAARKFVGTGSEVGFNRDIAATGATGIEVFPHLMAHTRGRDNFGADVLASQAAAPFPCCHRLPRERRAGQSAILPCLAEPAPAGPARAACGGRRASQLPPAATLSLPLPTPPCSPAPAAAQRTSSCLALEGEAVAGLAIRLWWRRLSRRCSCRRGLCPAFCLRRS